MSSLNELEKFSTLKHLIFQLPLYILNPNSQADPPAGFVRRRSGPSAKAFTYLRVLRLVSAGRRNGPNLGPLIKTRKKQ